MTNKDTALLVFLLDRSGSMYDIKEDIEGGLNAYVAKQRAEAGTALASLHQFDNVYEDVYLDKPLDEVPPFILEPRGSTALFDSIARTITETRKRIAAMPAEKRPGIVHLNIATDGLENASTKYSRRAIRDMVQAQEEVDKWIISYMGCDQDAVEIGTSLGISPERSLTYTRETAAEAMDAYSQLTSTARRARSRGADVDEVLLGSVFTERQRKATGK
ncbi:VWA domain-containing protein [Paeniglutamicibacter sp. NPDC012692]|uniref:VWA domain-containing protein n=1 Tax=Paeniglutamicibacter sp. NPDC012692 TaxID=3364388 RepID=UPI00368BAB41